MTKRCYVTSDLHMADGGPLEDFKHDDIFASWIDHIADGDTTLVLNGDIVDFALIAPWEPKKGLPSYLLWTENESVKKFDAAVASHHPFFDSLARFHAVGGTLIIVVGNHDLDWVWPKVQARLAEVVGACAVDDGFERLVVEPIGTEFNGVWIEHGHRFTPENAPEDPEDPEKWIHEYEGERYLERVWGTDFLVSFFNDKHTELRFANNIKPTYQLALQGLKNGWFGWRDAVRMVAFLARRGIPVKGALSATLSDDDEVDYGSLYGFFGDDEEAAAIILEAMQSVPQDEWAASGTELDSELRQNLSGGETIPIGSDAFGLGSLAMPDADDNDPDSPTLGLLRASREVRAAKEKFLSGYDHVVFGHTHVVVAGEEIEHGKRLYNPGCWIPFIDTRRPDVKAITRDTGITHGLLNNAEYYDTDFCAIEIIADGLAPKLISIEQVHGIGEP